MLTRKPLLSRGDGKGVVWPGSGTSVPDTIGDVMGSRPFIPHIVTVGYDYDFHRGVDIPLTTNFVSPITGAVVRWNESHFGFETASQVAKLTETDTSACLVPSHTGSALRFTGSRVGTVTIANAGRLAPPKHRIDLSNDWTIETKFVAAPSLAGRVGISVHGGSQYAALEYNGTTVYMHGTDAGGAMTPDATTATVSSITWLRLNYTESTTTLLWLTSTDGETWTTRGTDVGVSFTDAVIPIWEPRLYYRSVDAGGTETVDIGRWNYVDSSTVGRFGNWLLICDGFKTIALMHFQELTVSLGQRVEAGQIVGAAGSTGFDALNGRVLAKHAHMEWIAQVIYTYSHDYPVNPLGAGLLPRTNVSNNVSVVKTTANDPDAVSSTKLDIRIQRGDQDFDLNQVTCVGGTATRTVNWNTRSGLNVNNDIPKEAGVYIVAFDFDKNSTEYHVDFYFNTTIIGSFVSYSILDSAGTTLASG